LAQHFGLAQGLVEQSGLAPELGALIVSAMVPELE
jgi:hypothetical protein